MGRSNSLLKIHDDIVGFMEHEKLDAFADCPILSGEETGATACWCCCTAMPPPAAAWLLLLPLQPPRQRARYCCCYCLYSHRGRGHDTAAATCIGPENKARKLPVATLFAQFPRTCGAVLGAAVVLLYFLHPLRGQGLDSFSAISPVSLIILKVIA